MKLTKALLLTTAITLAASASATKLFDGGYVGAQLGTIKAAHTKPAGTYGDSTYGSYGWNSQKGYKKDRKWAFTGGILGGYRAAVAQDVILGASLGVDLNNSKWETGYNDRAGYQPSATVKQRYVVSLLGQAGYTVSKDVMPYVVLGASVSQFKFSITSSNNNIAGLNKNKTKVGFTYGAGVAHALNHDMSVDLQYTGTVYGRTKVTQSVTNSSGVGSTTTNSVVYAPKVYHAVVLGFKYSI